MAAQTPETQPATVRLSGPMTLPEVALWHGRLHAALDRGAGLRIDLAAAGPWDVAGLQLILSALASGKQSGRDVRLLEVPGVFFALAAQAGLAGAFDGAIESALA